MLRFTVRYLRYALSALFARRLLARATLAQHPAGGFGGVSRPGRATSSGSGAGFRREPAPAPCLTLLDEGRSQSMFETAIAQLRFAASLVFGRPFDLGSLEHLVDAMRATRQEFGA